MHVFLKVVKYQIHFQEVNIELNILFLCSFLCDNLDCQDLLSKLLEPSPTKRISMQEILRHPFLINQLGPIELTPYKPYADVKDVNKNIIRYLAFK
jgi:serine/threonine protein kinase